MNSLLMSLKTYTLENEKATDVALTEIAESFVNEEAASEQSSYIAGATIAITGGKVAI